MVRFMVSVRVNSFRDSFSVLPRVSELLWSSLSLQLLSGGGRCPLRRGGGTRGGAVDGPARSLLRSRDKPMKKKKSKLCTLRSE